MRCIANFRKDEAFPVLEITYRIVRRDFSRELTSASFVCYPADVRNKLGNDSSLLCLI